MTGTPSSPSAAWNRLILSLQRVIAQRPKALIVLFAVVAVGCALSASRLSIEPGLEYFLLEHDPERQRNQEIKREFANDEVVMVGLDLGRPYQWEDLELVGRVVEELEAVPGVDRVVALSTVEDIRDRDGWIETSTLIPEDLDAITDEAERRRVLEELEARLDGHPIFDGYLVSPDRTAFAVVLYPELLEGRTSGRINQQVVEGAERVVADLEVGGWIGGYPAAEVDSTRIALHDLSLLTFLALVVILALAALLQRHWAGLVLVVVLVAWTEALALGWLGLVRAPLTGITALLPTILVATATTYGLYAFALLREIGPGPDPGVRLVAVLARPCIISAVSTAAGFLALRFMPIRVLDQLGTALAIGILGCLLGCLLLVPAIVQLWRLELPSRPESRWRRVFTAGVDLAQRPGWVVVVLLLLAIPIALGASRVEIESDPITYWRPDSYHRLSDEFLRREFDGSLFVNVVLSTGTPDGALQPDALSFAHRLLREAESHEIVTQTLSVLDFLELIDDALDPEARGRSLEERRFFDSEELAAQYLLLLENDGDTDDYQRFVDFERSSLNLFLKVDSRSSSQVLALRDELYAFANRAAGRPPGLEVEVLGTWLLFPKAMDGISRHMIQGLAAATVAILVLMTVSLGSLALGLASVIPNLLPVLVCVGAMGWLGVPISFVTSITGCLALGLAVDDTAHILGHLGNGSGLERTYREVGPALLQTTLCLGVGFLVLLFSGFLPIAHLGIATALTLTVALLCDIFLLPSLLALFGWPIAASDEAAASTLVEVSGTR